LSGFTDPLWLLLIGVVAVLAVGYVIVQRLRVRDTKRFTNLELLERVAPRRPGWQRHIPPAMLAVGLILLSIALAGPTAEQKVPRNRATVMLVIDVSPSMDATDIQPSRIKAAQAAAKSFVSNMTGGVNLGLVTYGGSATVDVSPTTARKPVVDAIDNIVLQPATATGEAIAAALQSIQQFERGLGGPAGAPPAQIVLMSDGKQTAGRDEFAMAKECKDAKIPINTISYGTSDGVVVLQNQEVPVPVDDESLHQLADISGGQFFKADTSDKLNQIYASLGQQIGYETQETDVSKPFVALGAVLTVLGAAGALLLSQRVP
jgi:Ca-activated chloride channel family protein